MPFVKPFGIGDLIVLKKRLLEYETDEIAHIENIMAFEKRNRYHRRLNRLETTVEIETETEEERKHDLNTTERFELEHEIKNELKKQEKFAAGIEVSGGFGPVQISAYAKYDLSASSEESEKTAQKYAKEVTEKAMERIRETNREFRKSVELQETEERNEHLFDNKTAESHSGIYRWVNKKYLVKPINYGKRLYYEVVVPEPAAHHVFSKTWNIQNNHLPKKPEEPTILKLTRRGPFFWWFPVPLKPSDLNETNYASLVSTYGVEDVQPPPPARRIVSHTITKGFDPEKDFILDGEKVRIPEGYEATVASIQLIMKSWKNHWFPRDGGVGLGAYFGYPAYGKLQIGRKAILTWQGVFGIDFFGEMRTLYLDRETEEVPISGAGNYIGAVAMNAEIECERSNTLLENWQLSTYQAIQTAYKRELSDYEDSLAAARISGGVKISGSNPARNQLTIKDELKKSFTRLWMRDEFSPLPGWNDGNANATPILLPQMLEENASANEELLHFVEESFDWDNMSYKFLPYFSGRKSKWLELANYTDPDPIFENYLKAGAALVRIPVMPKFTHAVLYYQLTNRIWSRFAGDVPALSTLAGPEAELYNQYLGEVDPLEEDTDILDTGSFSAEDEEVYEITMPTQLVWLQSGSDDSDLNP